MPFAPPPPIAAPVAAARFDDPFAAMRPPEGKHFDLQSVDDGRPAVSVRRTASVAALIILIIAVLVAAAVGFGFGASSVGRRMFNQANFGAKRVKTELGRDAEDHHPDHHGGEPEFCSVWRPAGRSLSPSTTSSSKIWTW